MFVLPSLVIGNQTHEKHFPSFSVRNWLRRDEYKGSQKVRNSSAELAVHQALLKDGLLVKHEYGILVRKGPWKGKLTCPLTT